MFKAFVFWKISKLVFDKCFYESFKRIQDTLKITLFWFQPNGTNYINFLWKIL